MTTERCWEPSNPIEVTPREYERQVVAWLRAAEVQLTNFSVQHLETLSGSAGEYVIDAVAKFEIFGGVEIAVLVECKKLKRSVERDVVMVLNSKMQETGSQKGIIFSTSGFQRGAIDYAAEHGIALIKFVDGAQTYITKGAENVPRSHLPTDLPKYVGFWPTPTTRKQPHCGASFQPYGPASLSGVATLVAKTSTKALLGEVHPGTEAVYWASKEEIAEQGGRFTPDFLNCFSDVPEFGGTRRFEWRQKADCAFCGEA